jgi:hypothetical protein
MAPVVFSAAFQKLLTRHTVADSFAFRFTRSTILSYIGFARRTC